MNRLLLFVLTLVACKPAAERHSEPTATASTSATSAPAVMVPAPTFSIIPVAPAPPAGLIQVTIPMWLKMLEDGQDADFLQQAAVATETQKLLDHQSMSEIVRDFKAKRHAAVVKILTAAQTATPAQITTEGTRALVRFRLAGDKDATFVIDGGHVMLKDVYGR